MSSFDGTWETVTKTPMGDQKATLVLASKGTTLTGSYANAMGTLAVEDGKVDKNRATWTMKTTVPFPMTLEVDVTANGNALSGSVKAGAFGASTITGTKKA